MRASAGYDEDYDDTTFDDIYVRHAFIRKVCFILAVQLALTIGIVLLFMFQEDCRDWFMERMWIFYFALGVSIFCNLTLMCCLNVARAVPINYILLFTFTVFESIIIGYISILYKPFTVLVVLGITLAVCMVLTLFALQTTCDFTTCGGLLLVLSIVLILLSILVLIFPSRTLALVLCGFGILLFSFYLVFDIQMMVGGNHANQYNEEDYIVAALSIYVDIVNMFLYILILCGLLDA